MFRNISFMQMKNRNNENPYLTERRLFDLHSHVLPGIDDGSVDVTEAISMLKLAYENGIGFMIATPHFYPRENTPEQFMCNRDASVDKLLEAIKNEGVKEIPHLGLGAEVAFFKGMSRSTALEKLCIQGTRLILIEMPFTRWSAAILDDLLGIKTVLGLVPVIAHLDRYLQYQDEDILSEVLSGEVLIQINASSIENNKKSKRILKMVGDGEIDFLGSDCHNLTDRAPDMHLAIDTIEKKFGREALEEFEKFGNFALADAIKII